MGRVSRFACICLLTGSLALSAVGAEQNASEIPDIGWKQLSNGQKIPLWVSGARATDTKGLFDWDVVGDFNKQEFEAVLYNHAKRTLANAAGDVRASATTEAGTQSPEACLNLAESYWSAHVWQSVEEIEGQLVHGVNAIFVGEVAAIKGGLFRGKPGSLMKLDVSQIIKRSRYFEVPRFVYAFHFNGRFQMGQYEICNEHPVFSHIPEVGDTVIVFSVSGPLDPDDRFYAPSETVFVTRDGGVYMTPRMAALPGFSEVKSAYDVEQYVHRLRVGLEPEDIDSGGDQRQP